MKKPFFVFFAVALVLLSGCVVYQQDKTPPSDGVDKTQMSADAYKPRCLLSCKMDVQEIMSHGKPYPVQYGEFQSDVLKSRYRSDMLDAIRESECFSSCLIDVSLDSNDDSLAIKATCHFSRVEGNIPLGALLIDFTLTTFPVLIQEYFFDFQFEVVGVDGVLRQYQFKESLRERFGLLVLLTSPFFENCSHEEALTAMNRKVVNNLLVKMQKDGLFSAEARKKALAAKAAVKKPTEPSASALEVERRKNLDSLLKAGVITEDEYRKEIGKETK